MTGPAIRETSFNSTGTPRGRLSTPNTRRVDILSSPQDIAEKFRNRIGDGDMIGEIAVRGNLDSEPHDSRDPVQRSKALPRHREHVQGGGVRSPSAVFGVQLLSGAAQEFSHMTDRGGHPRQEQKTARLDREGHFNAQGRKPGLIAV
jgi:hypothetical protein